MKKTKRKKVQENILIRESIAIEGETLTYRICPISLTSVRLMSSKGTTYCDAFPRQDNYSIKELEKITGCKVSQVYVEPNVYGLMTGPEQSKVIEYNKFHVEYFNSSARWEKVNSSHSVRNHITYRITKPKCPCCGQ